jgi:hypothetical protein
MAALVTVGAAACGHGGGTHMAAGRAARRPDGSAHVMQAAYAATRKARTAAFRFTETIQAGAGGGAAQPAPVTGSGRADFPAQAFTGSVNLPAGGNVRIILVHGTEYIGVPPAVRGQIPGQKPWVSLNLNKVSQAKLGASYSQLAAAGTNNPAQVLAQLSAVSSRVSAVGSATVAGVPTTEYRADVNLGEVAARTQATEGPAAAHAVRREIKALGTPMLPVDVWIGPHHLVRQIHYQVKTPRGSAGAGGGTAALTLTFTSFGGPVHATPPPASQTADITDMILRGAAAGAG